MKSKYYWSKLVLAVFFLIVFFSCLKENTPDTVEIPFTLENNRFIIEATVNGKKGKFKFDSGSQYSYFDNVKNLRPIGFIITKVDGRIKIGLKYRLDKITYGDVDVRTI